jgi:ATP-dependent DNA ligase
MSRGWSGPAGGTDPCRSDDDPRISSIGVRRLDPRPSRAWLHYAAFDVLWLNGRDLRAQPLIKRKRRLEQLIPTNNSTLSRVLAVEDHGRELYEAAQRLDLEGIVAKRKADPYSPETIWYKLKNPAYTQAEGRGDLFDRRRLR